MKLPRTTLAQRESSCNPAAKRYLEASVPPGRHLADQLLGALPLAGGGSFVTLPPTRHATTNADVIRYFLGVRLELDPLGAGAWRVKLQGAGP